MAARKHGSGYTPTVRELAWFGAWTLLVLALVYLAKTHLNWEARSDVAEVDARGMVAAEPVELIGQQQIELGEAAVLEVPVSERSSGHAVTLSSSAMSSVLESSSVETVASGKGGWRPDSAEVAGDARRINPEEVRWLQERLDALESGVTSLSVSETYETVRRIARRVGGIPYSAQSHGWGLPEETLRRNEGDCADKSLLLAELLVKAGVEEVALCIGVSEDYLPGEPGHAWVQAMIGKRLWRIESTNGHMRVANSDWILDKFEPVATIWRTRD